MKSFEKQSWESFPISGSCVKDLEDGESVVLIPSTVSAKDTTGKVVSDVILDVTTLALAAPDKLRVQVRAGDEASSPYVITFKMVTDATPPNQYELDVKLKIQEIE